jgi:hypothetical protein
VPSVHLVHGFNIRDGGARTTDLIAPYFEKHGFTPVEQDYGFLFLLGAWACNSRIARRIAKDVCPGDIGCGHSNGCAILTRAADAGAPFEGLVLINPALDADIKFAPQLKWIHVYANKDDGAVKWAELIPHRLNKRWGDMGARGYVGKDARVTTVFTHQDQGLEFPIVAGHSDVFHYMPTWGDFIAAKAAGYSAFSWAESMAASRPSSFHC